MASRVDPQTAPPTLMLLPVAIDVNQLLEAARLAIDPELRQRAPRRGRIGACMACKQPIHVHFDAAGRFLGCIAASDTTVFVLVPVSESAVTTIASPHRKRQAYRLRYVPTLHGRQIEDFQLTTRQQTVLLDVTSVGAAGIRSREVAQHTGLSQGSVTQALAFLREQGIIDAHEDTE